MMAKELQWEGKSEAGSMEQSSGGRVPFEPGVDEEQSGVSRAESRGTLSSWSMFSKAEEEVANNPAQCGDRAAEKTWPSSVSVVDASAQIASANGEQDPRESAVLRPPRESEWI